jgi:proline iminopeptidase
VASEVLIFGLAEHHYRAMAHVFRRHPAIERVLIFGSRAKGTAKPWSDIDLAVVAPTMGEREFSVLWHELDALELVFKLDLLHWDRLGDQKALQEAINRQGVDFLQYDETARQHPESAS